MVDWRRGSLQSCSLYQDRPPGSEKLRAPKRTSKSVLVLTLQHDFHVTPRTHEKAEAAQILRHEPLHPNLRVNPFLDETDACCRFSLTTILSADASNLET